MAARICFSLPSNRRDKQAIVAILFRQFSGSGLRDTAQWFGLTRTRLSEWEQALQADGSLQRLMQALKLERASALVWSSGGRRSYTHFTDRRMADAVLALRFRDFRDALRGRSERDRDDLSELARLGHWGGV